jgi:hypothetical protein
MVGVKRQRLPQHPRQVVQARQRTKVLLPQLLTLLQRRPVQLLHLAVLF